MDSALAEIESYLSFFSRRSSVEETYIAELTKLVNRTELGTCFDNLTLRAAWAEIRKSTAIEVESKRAWVAAVKEHVILPLASFRDTQSRLHRRLKEELKGSRKAHEDYRAAVDRQRRTYERRCEDVQASLEEDDEYELVHPKSDPARRSTDETPSPPSQSACKGDDPRISFSSTSPDKKPAAIISGATSHLLRSTPIPAPSKMSLQRDWTVGKQQLNSLINRLGGGDRNDIRPTAVKNVQLKKQAEEADRDYRKGVFHLETLRLQRVRVTGSALDTFKASSKDICDTVKQVFSLYLTAEQTMTVTCTRVLDRAMEATELVQPERDTLILAANCIADVPLETPLPVPYYNFHVGACQSLIFGVALTDYFATTNRLVPLVVEKAIRAVDISGIHLEGIYRISGKVSAVQQAVHEIEKDEVAFTFDKWDPHVAAGILKLYLRQLPAPLFSYPATESQRTDNPYGEIARRIRRLPDCHRATLRAVTEHLSRVHALASENKMDASNLALIFSAAILGVNEEAQGLVKEYWKDAVMEDLILNSVGIFEAADGPQSRSRTVSSVPAYDIGAPVLVEPVPPTKSQQAVVPTPKSPPAVVAMAQPAGTNTIPIAINPPAVVAQPAGTTAAAPAAAPIPLEPVTVPADGKDAPSALPSHEEPATTKANEETSPDAGGIDNP